MEIIARKWLKKRRSSRKVSHSLLALPHSVIKVAYAIVFVTCGVEVDDFSQDASKIDYTIVFVTCGVKVDAFNQDKPKIDYVNCVLAAVLS